jgi:aminoglycoside phosphotransferase (APT) family kinase protein
VLCHGDLHPINILDDGGGPTVIDWTSAIVAPAAYDVAFTRLLLRHPPLVVPPALRIALAAGSLVLARRFVRRYRAARPAADLRSLDWYTALHAARILVDVTSWWRLDDPRSAHHPYNLAAPAAARLLARTTGIAVPVPAGD